MADLSRIIEDCAYDVNFKREFWMLSFAQLVGQYREIETISFSLIKKRRIYWNSSRFILSGWLSTQSKDFNKVWSDWIDIPNVNVLMC